MKKILAFAVLISSILIISCNQDKHKSNASITTAKEVDSKSEYKDSTSFKKDVKVFVKPTSQIKYIDSVTVINGNTFFLVDGKKYKASDLKSLE